MVKQTLLVSLFGVGLGLLGLSGCSGEMDDPVDVSTEGAALRAPAAANGASPPARGASDGKLKKKRRGVHALARHQFGPGPHRFPKPGHPGHLGHPGHPGHLGHPGHPGHGSGSGGAPAPGNDGSGAAMGSGGASSGPISEGDVEAAGVPADADSPADPAMGGSADSGYGDGMYVGGWYATDDVCGDGVWGMSEYCDDGNATSGDGCSDACQSEPGFYCDGQGVPCRLVVCGDGQQDWYMLSDGYWTSEECDDGNVTDGDGCSDTCQVEPGWLCQGSSCRQPACGDGQTDAGYLGGDSAADSGSGSASGSEDAMAVAGAGGMFEGTYYYEGCDDGNVTDGDGCSAACTVESGWICPWDGGPCFVPECGDGSVDSLWEQGAPETADPGMGGYGYGSYTHYEACDDGNTASGDGCSADCAVESGWVCPWDAPCRQPVCGDGYADAIWGEPAGGASSIGAGSGMDDGMDDGVAGARSTGSWLVYEECDDGNDVDDDGCTDCVYDGYYGNMGGYAGATMVDYGFAGGAIMMSAGAASGGGAGGATGG